MISGYIARLKNAFGLKFIFLIFISQCFIKGITFIIMTKGLLPLFKSMGLDAIQLQLYTAVALCPWTVKPLIGVLSDLIAIVGYHKRYMILFSCLVGIGGAVGMVLEIQNPIVSVIFLMMVHFEIAVLDLLIEGKYAEHMRENPETGSDIVTLATLFQQTGFLIAIGIVGPLSDEKMFRATHIVALCLTTLPVLPVWFGWLPEKQIPNAPYILVDTKRIRQDWKIILVAIVTGLSAPAMAAISAFAVKWLGLLCAFVVIAICVGGGFLAMPHPLIARVALYQVLAQVSKISFSNVFDYFFVADDICLPGGPNFDYLFYITITGLAAAGVGVITSLLYQGLLSKWKFRNVLLFTTLLNGLSGIFDFIIVKRWNLMMGIPDKVFFLIGDDVFESIVSMLYWIPSSSIIGKVCPKNMEASTYAYLAGISNFGTMISAISGSMLAELFGIITVGGPACNWDNFPFLVVIGHITIMLLVSIPAAYLIPNVPQDDNLLAPNEKKKMMIETETLMMDNLPINENDDF